jgi:hypothetical protein
MKKVFESKMKKSAANLPGKTNPCNYEHTEYTEKGENKNFCVLLCILWALF